MRLGIESLDKLIGRTDLLQLISGQTNKQSNLDLSNILTAAKRPETGTTHYLKIRNNPFDKGELNQQTLDDFKETLHLSNLHDISFLTAIQLGSELGLNMPEEIKIIAIEIIEDMVFSNSFTEPIQSKYDIIYKDIEIFLSEYAKKVKCTTLN